MPSMCVVQTTLLGAGVHRKGEALAAADTGSGTACAGGQCCQSGVHLMLPMALCTAPIGKHRHSVWAIHALHTVGPTRLLERELLHASLYVCLNRILRLLRGVGPA